uniref:Uncharacterized protein n=1 Tax=Plectus sambesii TaxID=2011161 RepID=A0A914VQH5_9BILA
MNNFATLTECNDFCFSSACKDGDAVFIDPSTQDPVECNVALQNSCPTNYECTYDTLTTGYVCCGATDM